MINSLRTIAMFGCTLTSRYRTGLCKAFNIAAEELGINMVYINFLGKIGNKNAQYGENEYDLIDYIDLDEFDGIVFDGEGYNVEGVADKVIKKLRGAKCPVVSISGHVDGFHNIDFDDCAGIRMLIEHLMDVHHFRKIGFMSGYLTHPDAQVRLKEFRSVMRSRGLPEDGVGMFEGDFWFNKGDEAADYFLSLPERPEAIVCANDYMAIALSTAFKERGIKVPEDIAVTGFDGSTEGQSYLPNITSATRERLDIARRSLGLLCDLCNGITDDYDLRIMPRPIYTHSCGCSVLNYEKETETVNKIYNTSSHFMYNLYDVESLILKLNKIDRVNAIQKVFEEGTVNIDAFETLFFMVHIDCDGRPSYDSDFVGPTGSFVPAMWIDEQKKHHRPEHDFDNSKLIPDVDDEKPHFYYIMSVHCAERMFGYCVAQMKDNDIFDEFYNVWLLNMALTLETLLKNDRINKLIGTLEDLSIRDSLTGMLNRRGFDELSREALHTLEEEHTVCSMVIDMDGLKHINDDYGHYEGDRAIKAVANIITKCCDSGEIAGRAGGDEFYIFAPEYNEKKLKRFLERLNSFIESYNVSYNKPYELELSYGTFMTMADNSVRLEDLLKESDSRMYEMKQKKPNRRK